MVTPWGDYEADVLAWLELGGDPTARSHIVCLMRLPPFGIVGKSGQYTPHRPTYTFHNVLITIVVHIVPIL